MLVGVPALFRIPVVILAPLICVKFIVLPLAVVTESPVKVTTPVKFIPSDTLPKVTGPVLVAFPPLIVSVAVKGA